MTTTMRYSAAASRNLSDDSTRRLVASYTGRYAAVIDGFKMQPGMLYTQVRAISARINQNFDAWPSEELKKSFRTFLGKPVFVNHQNFDPEKARGRVVAARYREAGDDKYIEVIQEIDAVRFPKLAKEIHEGGLDSVSMGVEAGFTKCSVCDNTATDISDMCDHVKYHKGEKLAHASTGEPTLVYENCLTPDMGILMEGGVTKRIADVAVGDRVIDHLGQSRLVTETHSRMVNEDIFRIRRWGNWLNTLEVTVNHPLLVVRADQAAYPSGRFARGRFLRELNAGRLRPEFVEAGQVREGDWVCEVKPSTDGSLHKIVAADYVRQPGHSTRWSAIHALPDTLELTEDFGLFVGWFLSEGSVNKAQTQVDFGLHGNEKEQAQSIVDLAKRCFGLTSATIAQYGNSLRVTIFSAPLAQMMSFFGTSSATKALPQEFLSAPVDFLAGVLRGHELGDGLHGNEASPEAQRKDNVRQHIHHHYTVSPRLAEQLYTIHLMLGNTPSHSVGKPYRDHWKPLHKVWWKSAKGSKGKLSYGPWTFTRVREIEALPYSGPVHNLEVEGTHTYTAEGMAVHNCYKLGFFELSYVFDPADETALVSRVVVANKNANAASDVDWSDLGRQAFEQGAPGNADKHPDVAKALKGLSPEEADFVRGRYEQGYDMAERHARRIAFPTDDQMRRRPDEDQVPTMENLTPGDMAGMPSAPTQYNLTPGAGWVNPDTAGSSGGSSGSSNGSDGGSGGGGQPTILPGSYMDADDPGAAFAEAASGRPYEYGGVGQNGGSWDCSGLMSDFYNIYSGQPTGTRQFTTDSDFASLGFQPGYMPGAFNIGTNGGVGTDGHMAGTLPNGMNVESSGSSGVTYGEGAAGALDPQFSQQWHYPISTPGRSAMRRTMNRRYAWGETEAPEDIDTLRDESEDDGSDDFHHYVSSPEELSTPDFDQAKRLDRAQEDAGLDADRRAEDVEQVGIPTRLGGRMSRYRYAEGDPAMMGGGDPSMGQAPPTDPNMGQMGLEEELALLNQAQGDLAYAESELYGGDPAAAGGDPAMLGQDPMVMDDPSMGGEAPMPEEDAEGAPPSVPPQVTARRRTVRNATSQNKERRTQKGRSMGINLSERGKVASRGRRFQADESGHVDGGPYGRNDQGEQEEIFLSQTPAEEAPADPVGDKQVSNTENTLVARVQAGTAQLRRDAAALAYLRKQKAAATRRQAADEDAMADPMAGADKYGNPMEGILQDTMSSHGIQAIGKRYVAMCRQAGVRPTAEGFRRYAEECCEPTTVNPPLSGTDEQSLKGDDFDSVALDNVQTQPKDASIHAFAAFDDWLARTTGKTARQHGNANFIRRQAARYIKATGIPLGNLFPTLEKVLVEARRVEANREATMKRHAEDMKLDVAAPGDRINVEAPVKNVTDADAQASQYDLSDYGHNAGDGIADPDLSTDSQFWAPGSGEKTSNRTADAVAAVRCAEAYINAGLAPASEKWKLIARFQTMRHATVVDRTRLLEAKNDVDRSAASRQRSAAVSRGTSIPRGLGSGQRTAQTNRVAANDPSSDSLLFFK